MRWQGNRKSNNVEDRRNQQTFRSAGMGGSGLLRLLPLVYRILGLKGTLILAAGIAGYGFYTGNLGGLIGGLDAPAGPAGSPSSAPLQESAAEREQVEFVSVILADTEATWGSLFKAMGQVYEEPRLILFRNSVNSACGMAQSATGPFYCPRDHQVYIDLGFFSELQTRFEAPGDFAQAYVIAHEVGHHVQTLLGISARNQAARSKANATQANRLSVELELQADCLAGVWGFHANRSRHLLEPGDVEEGLAAANAIGDDTLQQQSQGRVSPDSFTHGSSAQRVQWFRTGMEGGEVASCGII